MIDILKSGRPYSADLHRLACGRPRAAGAGLAWMNFFLLYVSLPARCSDHGQDAVCGTNKPPIPDRYTLGTMCAFVLAMFAGRLIGRFSIREATLAGLSAPTAISATWARVWRWRCSAPRPRHRPALIFAATASSFSIVPLLSH